MFQNFKMYDVEKINKLRVIEDELPIYNTADRDVVVVTAI